MHLAGFLLLSLSAVPLSASVPVVHSAEEVVKVARANHATVVHFWATWCGTCTEELPEIRRLEHALAAQGDHLLLVSLDDPSQAKKVSAYLEKERLLADPAASAVLLDAPDPAVITPRFDAKWTAQLPATFLLLESGAVGASYLGTTPVDAVLRDAGHRRTSVVPTPVAPR